MQGVSAFHYLVVREGVHVGIAEARVALLIEQRRLRSELCGAKIELATLQAMLAYEGGVPTLAARKEKLLLQIGELGARLCRLQGLMRDPLRLVEAIEAVRFAALPAG